MKKILIILIMILLVVPCFARTYTEEEFNEVYNALLNSTKLLDEAEATINTLNSDIEKLNTVNNSLTTRLEFTKTELENALAVLEAAEKELNSSTKVIKSLSNKSFMFGLGALVKTDFKDISFGVKLVFGHSLWVGYLSLDTMIYNDKSFGVGLTYSLAL